MAAPAQKINESQQNMLKIARSIIEKCNKYSSELLKLPRFLDASGVLKATISQIDTTMAVKQMEQKPKTLTSLKNTALGQLESLLDNMSKIVSMMGQEKNMPSCVNEAYKVFKRNLRPLGEDTKITIATDFITFLTTVDPKLLVYYGINDADRAMIDSKIKEVNDFIGQIETENSKKTTDGTSFSAMFQKIKATKEVMVTLAPAFKTLSPDFYNTLDKIQGFFPKINKGAPKNTNKPTEKTNSSRKKKTLPQKEEDANDVKIISQAENTPPQ